MVSSDRLNVPAIDKSAISPAVLCSSINALVPFLVGVLHYVRYSEAFLAVSSVGHLCACPVCRL